MKIKLRIYVAIILAMVFWALSFIWFKIANETFRPITIVCFRLIIAVVILFLYLSATRSFGKIRKGDRKLFLLLSVFEPFLYFIGESYGLTYVSATVGSVLISTIPVFATIGAWILFRERLRVINYFGIVLSFIGVIVFIIDRSGTFSYNLKGISLLFLAVFSAVGYNLTLGRLVGHYSPVFIVYVQNVIGTMLFLPVFLVFELKHLGDATITLNSFIPVIELALFASCGAFILFAFSVRNMGIARANVFTNFIPIFTAVLSFFILGDKLTVQNMLGMIVVIAGLMLSQINGRKKSVDEALILTGKTA